MGKPRVPSEDSERNEKGVGSDDKRALFTRLSTPLEEQKKEFLLWLHKWLPIALRLSRFSGVSFYTMRVFLQTGLQSLTGTIV